MNSQAIQTLPIDRTRRSRLAATTCSAAGVELTETYSLKFEISGAVDVEVIADSLARLSSQVMHGGTSGQAKTKSGLHFKWALKSALNQKQPNIRS